MTAGFSLLVYALTEAANTSLLSSGTLALLALSAAVLASFLVIEYRSKSPLMPLGFLRRGSVFTANALALLTVAALSGMIFLLTIYLQQLRGFSALSAGLAFLPTALVFLVVGGFLSARFVTHFGMKPVLVTSMVVLAAGFFLLSRITLGTPYFSDLLPSMLVASTGAALAFTAFSIAALSGARQGEEGLASGLVNTSTQVGGPVGLAIAVTIASAVAAGLAGRIAVSTAIVAGFGYAFLGGVIMAGVGVAFAASLRSPRRVGVPVAPSAAVQEPIIVSRAAPRAAEEKEAMGISRILVAVDGSESGYRAANTAIKFAKDYRAELSVLRVVTAPTALTPAANRSGACAIVKEFYDCAQKEAEDYVGSIVDEARSSGVSSARGEVVRAISSAASAIVDKANSEGVDLIVIGTRGLDRPKRLLLGSVPSGVVADADSQVLVVR